MIRLAGLGDIQRLNEIANHPNVFADLGAANPIDLSGIGDGDIILCNEYGAIVFCKVTSATYHFHTFFTEAGRGKIAYRASRAAAQYMFCHTNAMDLVTLVPNDNPAQRPPRTFGFKKWFERENTQLGYPATWYRLHIHDWIMRSKACAESGEAFHHQLEGAKDAVGLSEEVHDDDAAHDKYVGAAVIMSKAGKVDKGLMVYNNWAGCAGYHPALVKSRDPITVFVGDANWTLRDSKLEVELCR